MKTKYYIEYDKLKHFLQSTKENISPLLQTKDETKASQLTIEIIEDKIEELKITMEDVCSIGVADNLAIVYTSDNKNPETITFWLERAIDDTLEKWEVVQDENPILDELMSFIIHQDRYNNITNKEKFLI